MCAYSYWSILIIYINVRVTLNTSWVGRRCQWLFAVPLPYIILALCHRDRGSEAAEFTPRYHNSKGRERIHTYRYIHIHKYICIQCAYLNVLLFLLPLYTPPNTYSIYITSSLKKISHSLTIFGYIHCNKIIKFYQYICIKL